MLAPFVTGMQKGGRGGSSLQPDLAASGEMGLCYLFRPGVLRSLSLTLSPRPTWAEPRLCLLEGGSRGSGLRPIPPTLRELGLLRVSDG